MKCIHCNNDAKYSERSGRKCPKCGHWFAFEPKSGDPLTDAAFKAAIDRVSAGASVRWSKDHLYYEVARKLRPGSKVGMLALILAAGVSAGIAFAVRAFWVPAVACAVIAVIVRPRKELRLERGVFEGLWDRWLSAHGEPKGQIVRLRAPESKRRAALPSDITHYSFDRAVVTDRPETADILLANNFHFENNCAVLAVGGYPPEAFVTVRSMLKQNPRLAVYVLHDATVAGCTLAQKLRTSEEWFHPSARIVDVGLRPAHAGPFKGLWKLNDAPVAASLLLSEQENAWLKRYSLEVAVIRPEQVIKRMFRAITNTPDDSSSSGDGGGGGAVVADDASFGADADAADGGGDSFG